MSPIDLSANHLVIGFGVTGLSLVKTLHHLGAQNIWGIDSRDQAPNCDDIKAWVSRIHTGGFLQSWLNDCDYLWLSPGVPLATEALQACLKRLPKDRVGGDIELFARLTQDDCVIGITGTNGKSTVTTLVADILKADSQPVLVGGNLGEPALSLWLNTQENDIDAPVYVLELSSFQLETTEHLKLKVGAILNLAPDHLDRYEDFDHYASAKFKLLSMSEHWVVNADDQYLMNHLKKLKHCQDVQTFSLQNPSCDWYLQWKHQLPKGVANNVMEIDVKDISIGGLHNYANVMAACAICEWMNVSESALKQAIKTYQSLPHRCALVREVNGVRYYNDSKATNLPSTIAAIQGFLEPKWLILGGDTKDQDFSELTPLLEQTNICGVYLIGEDISDIEPCIPESCDSHYAKTLDVAVQMIHARAKSGDVVLFSPACASYDQFKNFGERGNYFANYVEAL